MTNVDVVSHTMADVMGMVLVSVTVGNEDVVVVVMVSMLVMLFALDVVIIVSGEPGDQ